MRADDLRQMCWKAVAETGTHQLVASQLKHAGQWDLSDRAAEARLSQMLSPSDQHNLPPHAIYIICCITGRQEIATAFMRGIVAHEDAMRETGEPPTKVFELPGRGMRKVEPGTPRRRTA